MNKIFTSLSPNPSPASGRGEQKSLSSHMERLLSPLAHLWESGRARGQAATSACRNRADGASLARLWERGGCSPPHRYPAVAPLSRLRERGWGRGQALLVGLIAATLGSTALADITVVSVGGAMKDAQTKVWYKPWEAKTGTKIIAGDYAAELAKVKVMVDTNSVSWDVVEMEISDLTRGCEEGLLEEISDAPALQKLAPELLDGILHPCGAGIFVWSTVLAYNGDILKTAPTGWADFFDLQKFPGKRSLYKSAKYSLEIALLGDGVPLNEVYSLLATKEGQDRAFAKLDTIKSQIQWHSVGAQPPQFLAAGDVVMSSAFNARIATLPQPNNLHIVWNGGIYDIDAFVVPKGSKNREQAIDFIAFSLEQAQQKAFAQTLPYGPVNGKTLPQLDEKLRKNLPSDADNLKVQLASDSAFWADYREQLEERFNAWMAR